MNRADGKLKDLKKRIAKKGKLLVAYSGGVDSSLLAKVAHDVLGDRLWRSYWTAKPCQEASYCRLLLSQNLWV